MRPTDFRSFAEQVVDRAGFDRTRLILGGDHLGPNPWWTLEPETAMAHALEMVAEYAAAGSSKIHLDASMPCGGEARVLTDETVAARAAGVCGGGAGGSSGWIARAAYMIGTEVPTPGGTTNELGELAVTSTDAVQKTLEVHESSVCKDWIAGGVEVGLALVVQLGVEFDHDSVVNYSRSKAAALSGWLRERSGNFAFEAHSTDYQKPAAYAELVQDGFAILKVGPALTFAMREALFTLAAMEVVALVGATEASHLPNVVEQRMLAEYNATPAEQKQAAIKAPPTYGIATAAVKLVP